LPRRDGRRYSSGVPREALTIAVLREIRDEIRTMRGDVNLRFAETNERLDRTNERLGREERSPG